MMLETVFGLSFIVQSLTAPVSLDSRAPSISDPGASPQISVRQRESALLPLVRRATECIVREVKADPRYSETLRSSEINDLIIDAMPSCATSLRALIDTHDRMYGNGSGEAFLMGPYLDILPGAVAQQVKLKPAAR